VTSNGVSSDLPQHIRGASERSDFNEIEIKLDQNDMFSLINT